MSLESPYKELFDPACGYAALGMYRDANEELERIDPFLRAVPARNRKSQTLFKKSF